MMEENKKEENKKEELKWKQVRKTLLLKVNDEIKKISDSKPALLINSKSIEELEKVYNRSNILLTEKGIVYSNYVKTVMRIYPNKNIPPKYREKSVNNKVEKTKNKLEMNGPSYEEEVVSPIINFIPKKINLGSKKKPTLDKRYTKNNGSIQKFIENNLNAEKDLIKNEDQLNKSTIFEKSNINKLIEKILSIKNNENMESIIKANIKKLRKYCYKFRIKKKKKRYKSKEPRVSQLYVGTSKNLSIKKLDKERKSTPFKIVVHRSSNKKDKNNSSLNHKRKMKKIKTLNEENGKKIINDLHDMKLQKPIKDIENINTIKSDNNNNKNSLYIVTINNHEEEAVPDLHNIKKELMRSFINERPTKFDIHNNNYKFGEKTDKSDKIKKNNKKKNNLKKMIMRNVSAFNPKDIEKIKFSMKKIKKEKHELEDNLNKNNNNNNNNNINNNINNSAHKNYSRKSENKKVNNINIIINNSFNHRRSRYSKVKKGNESKLKSKKKLIESPYRKIDNYSNCNTNYNTNNNFTLTQSSNEKIEKICKNYKKKVLIKNR